MFLVVTDVALEAPFQVQSGARLWWLHIQCGMVGGVERLLQCLCDSFGW